MIIIKYTVCVEIDYANDEYSKNDIKYIVEDFLKPMYNHVKYIYNIDVRGTI